MPKQKYNCANCNKEFLRYASTVRNYKIVYCSRKCRSEHQSVLISGENNPNFKHGKFIDAGHKLEKKLVKLDALIKDNINNYKSFSSFTKMCNLNGLDISRKTVTERIKFLNINIDHFSPSKNRVIKNSEIFSNNENIVRRTTVKSRFLKCNLSENKCSICGQIPLWNNKNLTLQLDHINGNAHDNRLENLRLLCPNCHSQTETFTGKKKKS